jgi:hypothetical protein
MPLCKQAPFAGSNLHWVYGLRSKVDGLEPFYGVNTFFHPYFALLSLSRFTSQLAHIHVACALLPRVSLFRALARTQGRSVLRQIREDEPFQLDPRNAQHVARLKMLKVPQLQTALGLDQTEL